MNKIGRKITDKLIEIHGSADFTIAFLPYKRSMWNSMESVYEECIRSRADAHCIPIPYYRMKENREKDYIDSDFEYFGNIAEPVEILEEIKPDFIAIHYQYNGQNIVTNMLPEFYTENIKERYNCNIIMLPYGLDTTTEIDTVGHMPPGLVAVDYVFCNSETNRINCINAWKKYGIDYSDRVFAFGSPKIDTMFKLQSEKPKEWASIIGTKKVALVINSLGPYLGQPYEKIKRYEQVICEQVEKGHAVIFRPHPLLRTTIKCMRADTASVYDRFVKNICKMEGVIYDESEYLERALSVADLMISDPSSVLAMWQATGKPYEVI